jgi:acetyl esterase/lipase
MKTISLATIICCFSIIFEVNGKNENTPQINVISEITYKTINGTKLNLWIFNSEKHKSTDTAPAIIIYFEGGCNVGNTAQFAKHYEYLSIWGMVADYRVKSRHGVPFKECVLDTKFAMRWVLENASRLGVDVNRIAAGGYLAAACATLSKFDNKNENILISSKPNTLILFNPSLVPTPIASMKKVSNKKLAV